LTLKPLGKGLQRSGKTNQLDQTVSGEILKLGWKAMIQYLASLLDLMNNGTLPGDWKTATVVPIHKRGGIDH
jgi:hypothetical protein